MSSSLLRRRRRPVRQPSLWSRLAALHRSLKALVPFPRRRWLVVVAAGIIAAASYFYATRNNIIIETFNVPKQWADQGLTGDVVARQIRDALENMEVAGHNSIQTDSFVVHADPDPI